MSFDSWSCGVSTHMVLLSVKGSIFCSKSGYFSPTFGISIAWRWHVFKGSIICSYLLQPYIVGIMIRLEMFMICLILCYDNGVLGLMWWDIWWLLPCSYGGDCVWLPHVEIVAYYMMFHILMIVSLCLPVLLAASSCWLAFCSRCWLDKNVACCLYGGMYDLDLHYISAT